MTPRAVSSAARRSLRPRESDPTTCAQSSTHRGADREGAPEMLLLAELGDRAVPAPVLVLEADVADQLRDLLEGLRLGHPPHDSEGPAGASFRPVSLRRRFSAAATAMSSARERFIDSVPRDRAR